MTNGPKLYIKLFMVKIKLEGHRRRTLQASELWRDWYAQYKDKENPLSVKEIAAKSINPRTGKPYHFRYIYKAFARLESL